MNASTAYPSSDAPEEAESDEDAAPNLWLDLLREFLDDFDGLSVDLQLAVIARLHQAGLREKAEELWQKVRVRTLND